MQQNHHSFPSSSSGPPGSSSSPSVMDPQRRPRWLQRCIARSPPFVSTYITLHLDSMTKLVNHLLAVLIACNLWLFFATWKVTWYAGMQWNTTFVCFLLSAQTVAVWLIVNNNRISALSILSPTDFMIGVAFGTTVGACIIAFFLSSTYRQLTTCGGQAGDILIGPKDDTINANNNNNGTLDLPGPFSLRRSCLSQVRAMRSVWWWSGLVFFFNFCLAFLLAMGRHELNNSQTQLYERIGGGFSMDDYENHFRAAQEQQGAAGGSYQDQPINGMFQGDMAPSRPTFVGDYADIPEIRTGNEDSSYGNLPTNGRNGSSTSQTPLNPQIVASI